MVMIVIIIIYSEFIKIYNYLLHIHHEGNKKFMILFRLLRRRPLNILDKTKFFLLLIQL